MQKLLRYLAVGILFIFGLITLFLSNSIFFDWFGIREMEGNYVLFVVIANFVASIFYLLAAYGFLKKKLFTSKVLWISVAVLVAAFAGLLIHIYSGGLYESKTIMAMVFRIVLTSILAVAAYFMINRNRIRKS